MEMGPYENEEVVLYMDELSGTGVMLKPLNNQGAGGTVALRGGTVATPSGRSRGPKEALLNFENSNNRGRNLPVDYGPEVNDLEPGSSNKRPDEDRGTEDGSVGTSSRYPSRGPGRYPFDVNIYQQKKTLAQGMMDLALISANANQFRYVLQSKGHPYYLASLGMIGTSLFLQIVVGIGLIWNSTYNVKKDTHVLKANKANNWTVIGIFLVTILNVFISSFGVAEPSTIGPLKIGEEVQGVETLDNELLDTATDVLPII